MCRVLTYEVVYFATAVSYTAKRFIRFAPAAWKIETLGQRYKALVALIYNLALLESAVFYNDSYFHPSRIFVSYSRFIIPIS